MRLIKHPVLCNYYVTYRCNATCHFCDIWEKPSPYVQPEVVAKNLDDLKRLGVRVVDFTGGEPLLHRQLPELLQLAKERGLITTVTTNGLLYPKMAEQLRGLVDMLHFSLDYYDQQRHDAARGVACYDFVMESIAIARSLGERPDILMTVFEDNLNEIAPLYEQVCQPNELMLLLNPVFEYNEVETGTALSKKSFGQLRNWATKPGVYLNEAFLKLREAGGNQVVDPVCRAGSSTIVISPQDQLVLPCYHLGLKQFPINGQLYSLWSSEQVQDQVALEGRHAGCQGCVINCYMQPSFAVELNRYWWSALPSTLKYSFSKGTWRQLFA